jgi:hypothetical protein
MERILTSTRIPALGAKKTAPWQNGLPPRDREITIRIDVAARACWDDELQTWVLARPVHVGMVRIPKEWR